MGTHACNTQEILCTQKNGNYNTSVVTLWRQMAAFLKFSLLVFISWRLKPKSNQIRLPFSGKFLSNLFCHISHSTKKKCIKGRASVSWQCWSWHLLSFKHFLSFPTQWANPLEKKVCCLSEKQHTSVLFPEK